MRPAERIPIIKRCAAALAATDDWGEIDFVLDQFGFPTSSAWSSDKTSYALDMLAKGRDGDLVDLDEYLRSETAGGIELADAPWSDAAKFRIFLSHVAKEKLYAANFKAAMHFYGAESFVAHEDIEPGAEWQRTILAALHSCDALVALLHSDVVIQAGERARRDPCE